LFCKAKRMASGSGSGGSESESNEAARTPLSSAVGAASLAVAPTTGSSAAAGPDTVSESTRHDDHVRGSSTEGGAKSWEQPARRQAQTNEPATGRPKRRPWCVWNIGRPCPRQTGPSAGTGRGGTSASAVTLSWNRHNRLTPFNRFKQSIPTVEVEDGQFQGIVDAPLPGEIGHPDVGLGCPIGAHILEPHGCAGKPTGGGTFSLDRPR
jgi:hypothetical protein